MSVLASYIGVILIWSTTPLAIKLSNDSLSPHAAILLRMLFAFIVVSILISTLRSKAVLKRANWKVYCAAGFGIFPNMSFVYIAANYIPSGMVAIIFALNPIFTGSLASLVLKETFFSARRISAIFLSLIGLLIIFHEQLQLDTDSWIGICFMLLSTLCFSISQVALKYFQKSCNVDAAEQILGSLCFALPGLIVTWFVVDGSLPQQVSMTSIYAISYLVVIATVLGYFAYFYILSNLKVSLVAAIPMATPVLALWMGAYFLHEHITHNIVLGTAFIVVGLFLYGEFITLVTNRGKRLIKV